MITRSLVQLPLWLLGLLLIAGVPVLVVACQALIRRFWPTILEGQHNDVAGFLIAVVGVLYAVILAFIVIVTWEDFRDARETVNREAGALRSVLRDAGSLPGVDQAGLNELVIEYGRTVAGPEWDAMADGDSSPRAFDLLDRMFSALEAVEVTSPTEEIFLAETLDHLNDVVGQRSQRLSAAEEDTPAVLWVAILVGGIFTIGFAMLFGVSDEKLHYLMVGGFAAIIALQVFVILVLNYPFSGDVRVEPAPIERVVQDFGG
jgi:Protein of unknown function (DUF4239)